MPVLDATAVVVALVAMLAAGVGGAVTYLVARRSTSGSIGTSDAATLWHASEEIRIELRAEVVALRARVVELTALSDNLKTQAAGLITLSDTLKAQAVVLLEKIDHLERRLAEAESGG
jgi:uncharacterized membrane protein